MKANNLDWLQMAEYVSLAGAVIGSVAAVSLQQVIYAAVPLSLSLLLNLFNRHRWEQLTRERLTVSMTQLDVKISGIKALFDRRIEDLRGDIAGLNPGGDLTPPSLQLETLAAATVQLQQQMGELQQSVAAVRYQLEVLTESANIPPAAGASQPYAGTAGGAEAGTSALVPRPEGIVDPQQVLRRYHW
ncbi:hypothetical protein [Kamptonema formosum]|uniref:hypothetical protein n=1 Tax=Kamptonema formosum TaxID=331992 RepID=UPI0003491812|nr:hypothetical protein [Oscillatoria sp. PCC 10802]